MIMNTTVPQGEQKSPTIGIRATTSGFSHQQIGIRATISGFSHQQIGIRAYGLK
jgi:hypothetical protein